MATVKQKKIAKLIIDNTILDKPLNGGQMLEKVGYSQNLVKQPGRVLESEGVKEALNDYGFNVDNAKKVVSEIMLNEKEKSEARLKATDQVFKVHKSYEDDDGGKKTFNITQIIINGNTRDKSNTETGISMASIERS